MKLFDRRYCGAAQMAPLGSQWLPRYSSVIICSRLAVCSLLKGVSKTARNQRQKTPSSRLLGASAPVDGKLLQHRLPLLQVSFAENSLTLNLQLCTLFRGKMVVF